jgi:hypothetical protein
MSKTKTPEEIAAGLNDVSAEDVKIAELKKKHHLQEIFTLRVGDAVAYLRKPNRKDVAMARSMGEGDYIATQELLLDAIWLEGDEVIRKDDDCFLNALPVLEGLIEKKAVELKKN